MKKLLTGDELEKRATELGVSFDRSADDAGTDHSIIQKRVIDAERSMRENRLCLIALISAIASVISALAAWSAFLFNRPINV